MLKDWPRKRLLTLTTRSMPWPMIFLTRLQAMTLKLRLRSEVLLRDLLEGRQPQRNRKLILLTMTNLMHRAMRSCRLPFRIRETKHGTGARNLAVEIMIDVGEKSDCIS